MAATTEGEELCQNSVWRFPRQSEGAVGERSGSKRTEYKRRDSYERSGCNKSSGDGEIVSDPNVRNKFESTALNTAAARGHLEMVQLLLENGADPNIRNQDGETALMRAADEDQQEVVELLSNYGPEDPMDSPQR